MMSLRQLALLLGSEPPACDVAFAQVSIDTRTLQAGQVYFAIIGYHLNGHDFIPQAVAAGASAVVVSQAVQADVPVIRVDDTTVALGQYAHYRRQQSKAMVFAVTGSVGKTTTRNIMASICRAASSPAAVLCPEKNFNNQWGLPLTLNQLNPSHQYAVLELGMRGLGEIAALTEIAAPDVAAITCARENHMERLGSLDNIAKAKGEIIETLPAAGVAVLNADDPYFASWKALAGDRTCLSFAVTSAADVRGTVVSPRCFLIETPQGSFKCQLSLMGEHNIINVLAATTMALAADIPLSCIKQGLAMVRPEPGRMARYALSPGVTLIDDSYNAAPDAMRAAIQTLSQCPGQTILVMGDMAELGAREHDIHQAMGVTAQAAGIDVLLTLGPLSLSAHRAFSGQARHFDDHESLLTYVRTLLSDNTVLLVKGSAGMKMSIIVHELLRNGL